MRGGDAGGSSSRGSGGGSGGGVFERTADDEDILRFIRGDGSDSSGGGVWPLFSDWVLLVDYGKVTCTRVLLQDQPGHSLVTFDCMQQTLAVAAATEEAEGEAGGLATVRDEVGPGR